MRAILIITLIMGVLGSEVYAGEAKVLVLKGQATKLLPGHLKAQNVKLGDILPERTSILTQDKSFVLIKLANGHKISLGGNSKIIIDDTGKNKASLISLLKGKVRSNVPKQKKTTTQKKNSYKAIIKTRHAAVGVRGTDFLIIHNPSNMITTNITFDGEVRMVKLDDELMISKIRNKILGKHQEEDLASMLDSKNSKSVAEGRMSGTYQSHAYTSVPTKISATQYMILKENTLLDDQKDKKRAIKSHTDKMVYKEYASDPPPEGFYNPVTKEYAPIAGGYLDLDTGIYVQTTIQADLDKKNNIYQIKDDFGTVDKVTGNYIPPTGLDLDAKKGFIIVDISDKDKLAYAQKVFGLDADEVQSQRVRLHMNKTLNQIFAGKLTVLNHHVKNEELKDQYQVVDENRASQRLMASLHDLNAYVNLESSFILGHSSSVTRSYFLLPILVTKTPSNFVDIRAKISNNNYLTNDWIISPFLEFNTRRYNANFDNGADPSYFDILGGIASKYNHTIGTKDGEFGVNLTMRKQSTYNANHGNYLGQIINENSEQGNESSLFTRNLGFEVNEKLYLTKGQSISLGHAMIKHDGLSRLLNGTTQRTSLAYQIELNPRTDVKLNYSSANTAMNKEVANYQTTNINAQANFKEIFQGTDLVLESGQTKNSLDDESFIGASNVDIQTNKLGIRKYLGHNFSMELNLQHDSYQSDQESIEVEDTQTQIGLKYNF